MTEKTQLLEVLPEASLYFLRAIVDDNEEIKAEEGEEERGKWEEPMEADTCAFENFAEDKVASSSLTLVETHEILDANILDRDEDLKLNIKAQEKEPVKGEISEKEKTRRAQVEQVLKAPDSMKIKYASHVWDKIRTWVEMTQEEISGMGCVKREKDGSFYVYEVFLLKQDNTSAFTDIDDEALMALMWEVDQLDEADGGTRYDDLKYWWHSHNNMSTFWSGQDERCIQTKLQHANWWLSTVHNIKNDINTRLDIADPPIRFDELKCELDHAVSPEIKEFCRKEYEEKVTEKNSRSYQYSSSYGNEFPGPYGSYWQGQGRYQGNKTTAATTTQAAKAAIEKAKAGGTAGAGHPAKSTWQVTQAQEKAQASTKASLKSLDFASIVNLSDPPALVNATPEKAAGIYIDEINIGKLYLGQRMNSMVVGKIKFIGLAYNPREASNKVDGIEWTVSGKICCGPERNCYMLVVWNDDPETVALSEIVEVRHRTEKGILMIGRSITVGDNKFINLAVKCAPDNIMITDNELQVCVGIIFEVDKALPAMHLGEDWLRYSSEEDRDLPPDDFMGNIIDIEPVTEEHPDPTEPISVETTEESIQETKEFFDELVTYAESAPPAALETRIMKTVSLADKEILSEVLGLLACNMAKDADEQALDEEADWLTQDKTIEKIEMFVKRDPREAFPYVWSLLPYMYICDKCYEPTTKEAVKCPNCGEELPEVQE